MRRPFRAVLSYSDIAPPLHIFIKCKSAACAAYGIDGEDLSDFQFFEHTRDAANAVKGRGAALYWMMDIDEQFLS